MSRLSQILIAGQASLDRVESRSLYDFDNNKATSSFTPCDGEERGKGNKLARRVGGGGVCTTVAFFRPLAKFPVICRNVTWVYLSRSFTVAGKKQVESDTCRKV